MFSGRLMLSENEDGFSRALLFHSELDDSPFLQRATYGFDLCAFCQLHPNERRFSIILNSSPIQSRNIEATIWLP